MGVGARTVGRREGEKGRVEKSLEREGGDTGDTAKGGGKEGGADNYAYT